MAKRDIESPAEAVAYPRHPAVKNWSDRVVKETKNGTAKFMFGLPLTPQGFADLYQDKDINTIPAGADPDDPAVGRYWMHMGYDVGASDGEITQYILIKKDGGYVHARPVTKKELKQKWKVKGL